MLSPSLAPAPRPDRLLSPAFVMLCGVLFFAAHAPNLFVVTPPYMRSIGLDEQHVGIVMGAFPLAALFCMPFVSRLADRLGRRAPLVLGTAVCAFGCAAFEWSTAFPALVAARAVQGIGWAGVLVGGSIFASELAPPGRLAQSLGVAGVLTLLAMALGPAIGELILRQAHHDWVFRVAALMALAGMLVATRLPDTARRRSSPAVAAGPIVDPAIRQPLLATFLVATGFGAILAFLADYARMAGLGSIAPFFATYCGAAILARLGFAGLSDRLGRHPVLVPALGFQALALAGLGLATASWQLWPLGALFGFSHGMYYPALQALIVERAREDRRARAIAGSNFAFSLGIAASAMGNGVLAKHTSYSAVYVLVAVLAGASMAVMAVDGRMGPTSP